MRPASKTSLTDDAQIHKNALYMTGVGRTQRIGLAGCLHGRLGFSRSTVEAAVLKASSVPKICSTCSLGVPEEAALGTVSAVADLAEAQVRIQPEPII